MEGLIYCLLCPLSMKSSAKSISFLLVFLFLAGAMNSIVSEIAIKKDPIELEEESQISERWHRRGTSFLLNTSPRIIVDSAILW